MNEINIGDLVYYFNLIEEAYIVEIFDKKKIPVYGWIWHSLWFIPYPMKQIVCINKMVSVKLPNNDLKLWDYSYDVVNNWKKVKK